MLNDSFLSIPLGNFYSLNFVRLFVVALSLSEKYAQRWQTISFASTLCLQPVLDYILTDVPLQFEADLRLGLQEALVNAAKHGNNLDPSKTILVQFTRTSSEFWWVIVDQGCGFSPPSQFCCSITDETLPEVRQECGRGLYILYHIFDDVYWNGAGNELRLHKDFRHSEVLLQVAHS
ncbi:MAG: ATP-binding protein [Leptolyngbyaceae cyanobacterium MAG.088]|nr:ATP-binding protein [Leptolyngbyaceae cyanobacterium MAG.088]